MKVIDLLNKIAKGEYPKEIIYKNDIYVFKKVNSDVGYVHNCCGDNKWFAREIECDLKKYLNEDIEIIEDKPKEDKKIEKISLDDYVEFTTSGDMQRIDYMFNKNTSTFVDKINEIIDKINGE